MTDGLGWLTERQRHGGVDRVPLPDDVPGALWLCGKHAAVHVVSDTSRTWTVVCLTERHELVDRYPEYVRWLDDQIASATGRAIWWPIHDLHAPPPERATAFVDVLVGRLRAGEHLLVHCGAGIGRAGTIAVGILVRLGHDLDGALGTVARARPGAGPEVGAQRSMVEALAERLP